MRNTCLIMLVSVLFCGQIFAFAPANADVISGAQEYGQNQAELPLAEFLGPWTVFEERAVRLDKMTERATLYTPFLLVAADARDKLLGRRNVSLTDGEKVLTDYSGYLVFAATVFGSEPTFAEKGAAVLKQGGKIVKARLYSVPFAAEKTAWSTEKSPVFAVQCYVYFFAKDINLDKPVTLQITVNDKRRYRYYFDLSQFR